MKAFHIPNDRLYIRSGFTEHTTAIIIHAENNN